MNAWCAEWGSRIKFFFSELYFRTWCGNSGRIAADFYLHPSEIPDAFMVLHCALLPSDWSQGRGRDADSGAASLETGGGVQEEAAEDQGEGAGEAEGSGQQPFVSRQNSLFICGCVPAEK